MGKIRILKKKTVEEPKIRILNKRTIYEIKQPPGEDKVKVVLTHSSGITKRHINAVAKGLRIAAKAAGVKLILKKLDSPEHIAKMDRNEQKFYNKERGQMEVQRFINVKKYHGDHIRLHLTAKDLYTTDTNFIFGGFAQNRIVYSPYQFEQELGKVGIKPFVYFLQHEFGHALGATDRAGPNMEAEKLGWHCSSRGCTMNQALSVDEANSQSKKQMAKVFCKHCLKAIKESEWF